MPVGNRKVSLGVAYATVSRHLNAASAGRAAFPFMVLSVVKSTPIFRWPAGWSIAPSQCPSSGLSSAHAEVAHTMPRSDQDRPTMTDLFIRKSFLGGARSRRVDQSHRARGAVQLTAPA